MVSKMGVVAKKLTRARHFRMHRGRYLKRRWTWRQVKEDATRLDEYR